jgi:hypothetical protein
MGIRAGDPNPDRSDPQERSRLAHRLTNRHAQRPPRQRVSSNALGSGNPHDRFVAVTDLCFPPVHSLKQGPPSPSMADADHRDLATDHNLDNMPNTCHLRGTAMHTVSLTPLSPPQGNTRRRKIFLQGPKVHKYLRMSAPFPPIQSQTSPRSFYFPCNKLPRPSISCIPARAIPVTEVFKWQQQPRLKQRPQQRIPIPSNAG